MSDFLPIAGALYMGGGFQSSRFLVPKLRQRYQPFSWICGERNFPGNYYTAALAFNAHWQESTRR